jgi:hypothetical protein
VPDDPKQEQTLVDLFDLRHSPPAYRPCITLIGASRDEIVPGKGEQREQQRTDADWHDQKAPGHVVGDHDQRIDSGRGVRRAGQVHRDHRHTNRQRRGPWRRSAQLDDQQANQSGEEVAADEGARLCRLCPSTVTIEVANGIATSGNAVVMESASMLAIAIAPPAAPASMARN